MKILKVSPLKEGGELWKVSFSDEEKAMIRKDLGCKRLTKKRLREWFLSTLTNSIEKET